MSSRAALGLAGREARPTGRGRPTLRSVRPTLSGQLQDFFVHKAPHPIFAGFDGLHQRMGGRVKVFCRVAILRRIAAAHVAADQAEAKVDPAIAHAKALFAAVGVGLYVVNLIQVRASRHNYSLGCIGRSTSNMVRPGSDSNRMSPRCRITIRCAMSSPSPVPWPTSFVVKNCSKTRGCKVFGIPGPLSITRTYTRSRIAPVCTTNSPCSCMASMALSIRLVHT